MKEIRVFVPGLVSDRPDRVWVRPKDNADGSCFRCDGQGWVDLCGRNANGPDDGVLWGVVRACWWCCYVQSDPDWLVSFFSYPVLDVDLWGEDPMADLMDACREGWFFALLEMGVELLRSSFPLATGTGALAPEQMGLFA